MSSKWTLDVAAMQDNFFADSALIGISSALPAYRFCWLLNQHFDVNFVREPELDVCLHVTKQEHFFSIYQYCVPGSEDRYMLYKLKNNKHNLLPEAKQLDYLWLIQSSTAGNDALQFIKQLRTMADVQLAQQLMPENLKSSLHLVV